MELSVRFYMDGWIVRWSTKVAFGQNTARTEPVLSSFSTQGFEPSVGESCRVRATHLQACTASKRVTNVSELHAQVQITSLQ